MSIGTAARTTLAGIRIFNGAVGLFAAHRMAAQLGSELGADKAFVYPARMFGIRTLVLGFDLLRLRDGSAADRRLLREAVLIHATDTAAAAYAGRRGELPAKAARLTTTISAVNTALAVISLVAAPKAATDAPGAAR
ncbi:hypothetical protein [Amycolatopsis vastitatis]|uniref:Uncharacterized protein n=1 Tax=Amycolatopsis vastitatis TaxID=1905142 RepID=A0A229SZP5_9PSEU|nr:hypothetical protein [Amycolatopsis vastitatis]OXM64161.1 hypothetical protein CF165_27900 [Amycolatopsis vastitatis]